MTTNDVKKDLYKSKNMAKFSHYVSGNLYYQVELADDGIYQFPISTYEYPNLSEDLGTTVFSDEIRGSELIRWISKAIDNNEFNRLEK
jgi:hypothetical protein